MWRTDVISIIDKASCTFFRNKHKMFKRDEGLMHKEMQRVDHLI